VTFAVQFHFTRFLLLATVFCGPAEGPLGSRMRKLHFESHVSDRCETRYLGPHDVPNRSQERSGTFSSRRRERNLEVHDRAYQQLIACQNKYAGRTDIAGMTFGSSRDSAGKFP
jgi:hypothetical protein